MLKRIVFLAAIVLPATGHAQMMTERGDVCDDLTSTNVCIARAAAGDAERAPGWPRYYNDARRHARAGEQVEAIEDYSHAIQIDPERADFYFYRGVSYHLIEDYAHAVSDYSEAIRLSVAGSPARVAELYFRRAHVFGRMAGFDAMLADVVEAIALNPLLARNEIASLDFAEDNLTAAVTRLSEILASEPDNFAALHLRARAYRQLEDWPSVVADYTRVLDIDPTNDVARMLRGGAWQSMAEYENAAVDFDHLAAESPNAYFYLNAACWNRALWGEELDRAYEDCSRSIAMRPSGANYDSRGLVQLRRGEFDAAIADYDQALARDPDQPESFMGRGIAKIRAGRTAQGEADIARALELNPEIEAEFAGYGVTR